MAGIAISTAVFSADEVKTGHYGGTDITDNTE
jgi:hypothetical protein